MKETEDCRMIGARCNLWKALSCVQFLVILVLYSSLHFDIKFAAYSRFRGDSPFQEHSVGTAASLLLPSQPCQLNQSSQLDVQQEPVSIANPWDSVPVSEPSISSFITPGVCNMSSMDRTALPFCSMRTFHEYFKVQHSLPECGAWLNVHAGFGYTEYYGVDFCQWQPVNVPECFLRKNIKKVFMTGDSNGFRLFLSLLNMTIESGSSCVTIDHEQGPIDLNGNASYYAGRLGDINLKTALTMSQRGCKWCKAQVYLCKMPTHQGIIEVEFDFIESYIYNDDSMKVSQAAATKYGLNQSDNMQEFLFKNYFVRRGHPDVMFLVMPHNHEKNRNREQTLERFRKMMAFIAEAKPKTLPLIFVPTAGEFGGKKLTGSYGPKSFGGLTPQENIYRINAQIYPLLEPYLLNAENNMHAFINLVNASVSKVDWNIDGVHYIYLWYNNIIRTLISTFCA